MKTWENTADLAGRILIAGLFLIAGIGKLSGYAGTQGYMASMGVPGVARDLADAGDQEQGRNQDPAREVGGVFPGLHRALLQE